MDRGTDASALEATEAGEPPTLDEVFLHVGPTTSAREHRVRAGIPMAPSPAPLLTTSIMLDGRPIKPSSFADGATLFGLTFEQLLERAVSNTRAAAFEIEPHRRFARGVQVTGSRLSGLLAAPEVFESARDRVDGELLVIAPTGRDIALVGSEEPALWAAYSYAVIEYAAALPPGLSPLLYRVVPAADAAPVRLEAWVPPADSSLRRLFERARLTQMENTYGPMMQDALGDGYTFRQAPAAVAKPIAAYNADLDAVLSFAVWDVADVRPCLLPPTDAIAVDLPIGSEVQRSFISVDELRGVPGVELIETEEFGPPVTVAAFTARREPGAAAALSAGLVERGARTAAELGGIGEPASILDWVPSKNGWYGKRATTATTFPALQWPAAA